MAGNSTGTDTTPGAATTDAPAPAPLSFLPPVLPKEYMYNFVQDYTATSTTTGTVLNRQVLAGSQYWSLEHQAQRGVVSSRPGVDKGSPTAASAEGGYTACTSIDGASCLDLFLSAHRTRVCPRALSTRGGARLAGDCVTN